MLVDDSAETDLWTLYGISYSDGTAYPSTQAYSISCFVHACQLSVILNQIIIHIYDPYQQNTEAEMEQYLKQESQALIDF